MQAEKIALRKADRTVGVNCYIFSNISSGMAWLLQEMLPRKYTPVSFSSYFLKLQSEYNRQNKQKFSFEF